MPSVSSTTVEPSTPSIGPAAPESYRLTGKGLRLSGSLWKVNEFIPLKDILVRFRAPWEALNEERTRIVARYPTSLDDGSWTKHEPRRERAVTQILFGVLTSLRASGKIAAAGAIWESTRKIPLSESRSRNFMKVMGRFPGEAKLECRKNMFQLEEVDYLTYHPEWLIDRIMTYGGLWAGVLVKSSSGEVYTESDAAVTTRQDPKAALLRDLFDEASESGRTAALRAMDDPNYERMTVGMMQIADNARNATTEFSRYPEMWDMDIFQSPLGRPLLASMLYQMTGMYDLGLSTYPTTAELPSFAVSRAYIAQYCMYTTMLDAVGLYRDEHVKGQKAIFDVEGSTDGSVLVLTPFNLPLETVPAPSLRYLSISWVVESVKRVARGTPYEVFRPRKMVKGMWPLAVFPGGRYQLV